MDNPWLDIPLADYEEAHMALPSAGQARLIADELDDSIAHVPPSPYASLQVLASEMRLVPQEELQRQARLAGFSREHSPTVGSAAGKRFCINEFRQGGLPRARR